MSVSELPNPQLIEKYNVPGPRYTSYPTVPFWKVDDFSLAKWKDDLSRSYDEHKDQGISLYIHLPFCESLCTFCGCHKHITKRHDVEDPYISTVLQEWQLYVDLLGEKPVIKELHLGGGTPTFFSAQNLNRLIRGIADLATISADAELGFEGHPNNTTAEHLMTLRKFGFTRVSFGVQDYAPHVQQAINRIQPFVKVKEIHEQALDIGYQSISHDLVFGLPHQRLEDIQESIRKTLSLMPHRISLYSYAHVPWIKGVGQRGFDEKDLPSPAEKRELYEVAKLMLLEAGYYEIGMDHFALPSDPLCKSWQEGSLHRNFMGYTTQTSKIMIGLGMSAISDSWTGFAQNVKTVKDYQAQVEAGIIPVFRGHLLSTPEQVIRQKILDLMCRFETTFDGFSDQAHAIILERLRPLQEDGMLSVEGDHLRVSDLGKVFIRNICMCFDEDYQRAKSVEKRFSKTV